MKRYIVKAPVEFHFIGESADDARQRLVDLFVALNKVLSTREGITFEATTKVRNLEVEERDI